MWQAGSTRRKTGERGGGEERGGRGGEGEGTRGESAWVCVRAPAHARPPTHFPRNTPFQKNPCFSSFVARLLLCDFGFVVSVLLGFLVWSSVKCWWVGAVCGRGARVGLCTLFVDCLVLTAAV